MDEERLKIAVFVDFDNIEIGVKTKLNRHFDVGTVLEAIKERGEVVTKIAYGNWKQAESYSREMAEHAVQMVQRNTTPGGDKNGADINLALDALEMAFTRDHINAFVIVGGDSDFIALVEKLKQYDKKVFVVGGRAFTSLILQKNCHEFIAYENLVGVQSSARKAAGREPVVSRPRLDRAMPLVRRALKVLSEREVSPQLGLLKSTLLQLDSTFSERDYGAGTFREFIQKLAHAGLVNLKQVDRSLLVELRDGETPAVAASAVPPPPAEPAAESREAPASVAATPETLSTIASVFRRAKATARWPMYLRNVKQILKSADSSFDERRLGFAGIHDLVREAQRAGLFRVERDRQGILRVYPGERLEEEIPTEAAADAPPEPANPPAGEVESVIGQAVEAVLEPAEEPSVPAEAEEAAEAAETVPEREAAAPKPRRRRSAPAASRTAPRRKSTRKTARKSADVD